MNTTLLYNTYVFWSKIGKAWIKPRRKTLWYLSTTFKRQLTFERPPKLIEDQDAECKESSCAWSVEVDFTKDHKLQTTGGQLSKLQTIRVSISKLKTKGDQSVI